MFWIGAGIALAGLFIGMGLGCIAEAIGGNYSDGE